jgi:hypothetical protein
MTPGGRWRHIITQNVHATRKDKIDDRKYSFYKELERVVNKFPKYHMKILITDINTKVGREDTFKPITGDESLHEIGTDNGVGIINFATSKNLTVKNTTFSHRKTTQS